MAVERRGAEAAGLGARLFGALEAFATADGYIVVATRQEGFWRKLCLVLEHPDLADDPLYADNATRVKNSSCRGAAPGAIFRTRTSRPTGLRGLRAADVPAAPVNNFDGAFAEPPVAEREMIVEYDHPEVGKVRLPGNPIKNVRHAADDFAGRRRCWANTPTTC